MEPEQIIAKLKANNHQATIYFDDDGRYVMALQRDATYRREWAFATYNQALGVAEWLRTLSDYQRDVLILEIQANR